jgi:SAM-dependent methyltransferase
MTKDPWAAFWNDGGPAAQTASLAELSPATQARLDTPWRELSRSLPKRGKVLDLATGGGIVLELLRAARPDLQLTGVDAAKRLPKRAGMSLKAGVVNERLPFPAAAFDAVTSRFGIEYGALEASAHEAARILRPGGRLVLILHHADGVVLRHNRERLEALRWAALESGWFGRAMTVARGPVLGGLPQPGSIRAAPAEAAAKFPDQPVAAEFLTGLNQVLAMGASKAPAEITKTLDILLGRAHDEISRLEALVAAACSLDRVEMLRDAFAQVGVAIDKPATLTDGHGAVLAWHLSGCKR